MNQVTSNSDTFKLTYSKDKTLLTYELPQYLSINDRTTTINFKTLDQFKASFDYCYEFELSPLVKQIILEKNYPSHRIQIQLLLEKKELTQGYYLSGISKFKPKKCIPSTTLIEVIINEIKNPIIGLLATSDLYLNYGKEFELDQLEYFGITRDYAHRLTRFIDHVICLLKLENNEISYSDSPIHFKTILRNFENHCNESHLKCTLDFEETVHNEAFCIGNEELIQLAFKNILLNAIQYGEPERVISIKNLDEFGFIGISVSNYGMSIKPENALTVLESFTRQRLENQKNNPDGFGMGRNYDSPKREINHKK